jgi:hypothetical protein
MDFTAGNILLRST